MKSKTILVVAPHPDDETLGCGGTILKHIAEGDQVHWLILTNIHTENGWPALRVEQRQQEIDRVAECYGFTAVYKLDFPTMKLDEIPMSEQIGRISEILQKVQPHTIYLQNRSDIHTDHQIGFKAVLSAAKSFRLPSVKRILMYETLTETDYIPATAENAFIPNVFSDITEHIDKKIEIMKIYESEIMTPPQPRSLENIMALAKIRGARICTYAAEAFQSVFEII